MWLGGDGLLSAGVFYSSASKVYKHEMSEKDYGFEPFWEALQNAKVDDDVMFCVRDNTHSSPIYNAYNKHNLEVIKNVHRKNKEAVELLYDYGVQFKPWNPNIPYMHAVKAGELSKLVTYAKNDILKNGGEILTGIKALELVTNSEGKVIGLLAEHTGGKQKGEKICISASKVILATGGFVDNNDLMTKYKGFWKDVPAGWTHPGKGIPTDHNGEGILMAQKLGAALESMESMPKFFIGAKESSQKLLPFRIMFLGKAYLLNPKGERIQNEFRDRHTGAALKMLRSGYPYSYVLIDQETLDSLKNDKQWEFDDYLKTGGLVKCGTLKDVADLTGMDLSTLEKTINRINNDASRGIDTQFGRTDPLFKPLKAPYYVSGKGVPVRYKTEGGLEVNPNFQVLQHINGNPIPGLYAVGAGVGSITTRNCDVFSSGLIAGSHASKH